ncbi:hypothetical protein DIS18_05405 [Algibacter marinivivus]|uniref:Lipoprotein n=1 Tax=Algibacter marinivivus TaxID=2100723 RepID=A0A2U2X854_9FLAO|nr:hypothetical protein [Algibacter marinivivus]PWH83985.1 hypothetical protein DIS18_05405 [Algibacter marinivivus]
MNKYIFLLLTITCLLSCKSISVHQEFQETTTQNIQLGTVGEQKKFLLEQDYNHTALPKYQKQVKVQVSLVDFNTSTFKIYQKAKPFQNKTIVVNYIDSIKTKPKFLKLEIADRIAILNTLNDKDNKDIFQFLKNKTEAHIITTISVVFNQETSDVLSHGEEVFLEQIGVNNYALKIYKNKIEEKTIYFNDGVVFGYQTSNACWKQDDKYQLGIVDLVENNDQCPNNTYRSAKRAKKKINYYKF